MRLRFWRPFLEADDMLPDLVSNWRQWYVIYFPKSNQSSTLDECRTLSITRSVIIEVIAFRVEGRGETVSAFFLFLLGACFSDIEPCLAVDKVVRLDAPYLKARYVRMKHNSYFATVWRTLNCTPQLWFFFIKLYHLTASLISSHNSYSNNEWGCSRNMRNGESITTLELVDLIL